MDHQHLLRESQRFINSSEENRDSKGQSEG